MLDGICICKKKFYNRTWLYRHIEKGCTAISKSQQALFLTYNRCIEDIMDGDPENEATFTQVQFLDGFVKHQNADVNMHFGTYVADYQSGMPKVSAQIEKIVQTDPVEEYEDRGDFTKADLQPMVELLEEML